jgi:23S rRNA pseudouridine2605 synthase
MKNDSFNSTVPKQKIRLQKFIADCGFSSRRKAEEFIKEGRVKVNGVVASELGTKVNPENDVVSVDGQLLDLGSVHKHYILMNKPRGFVTTLMDPEGRRTVMDLIKEVPERVYPIGRLDYLSEGLLLLTNDGDMANKIMHPRYNVTKVYEVKVFGSVNDSILRKLRNGVNVDGVFLKPMAARVIKQLSGKTWLEFRLCEGKNREIRKICEASGLTIDKLKRVAIEELSIDQISPGNYTFLTKRELLKCLGFNREGQKLGRELSYVSSKKSINIKKRRFSNDEVFADDSSFRKFRKETYFEASKGLQLKRISQQNRGAPEKDLSATNGPESSDKMPEEIS